MLNKNLQLPPGFPTMMELDSDEFRLPTAAAGESPLHGYRGADEEEPFERVPAGLTIAISREAGARGLTIGQRAGEKLGWEVYSQEMLEYGLIDKVLTQMPRTVRREGETRDDE